MKDLYPKAQWRPLGNPAEEPVIGIPRGVYWHTMVGRLLPTERYFKEHNGASYEGTESHFGVGGSWDGPQYDGVGFQWQRMSRQADAQGAGNAFLVSVESSDGGNPDNPFTVKQIEWHIAFGEWFCRETGRPAREMRFAGDVGFGFHSLFKEFNPNAHSCPNPARISQLRKEIWPQIAANLAHTDPPPVSPPQASVVPKFPLKEGGYFGEPDGPGKGISGFDLPFGHPGIRQFQKQFKNRGWKITVDGKFGEQTGDVVEAFQREKRLGVDRKVGLQTWNALWLKPIT